jgi:hypothetical protein
MESYWQRLHAREFSRRRFLAGAGSLGFGAAALALLGCRPTSLSGAREENGWLTKPRLLKFTPGIYPWGATGAVEGDLAEAVELAGDRMQVTFRLRPGLYWDPQAPTNGRTIDAAECSAGASSRGSARSAATSPITPRRRPAVRWTPSRHPTRAR